MAKRTLQLYDILPEYIRQQDKTEHTKKFLSAADQLLDQLHDTLNQYYADNFPESVEGGTRKSQDWLLPYFADLLDVKMRAPTLAGRRQELNNAIRWRQRKGTLKATDEIAEAIGQFEYVVQEGWKRLAMTPRLNEPLLPESYFGLKGNIETEFPHGMNRHPTLPATTPDFRCGSKAVADTNQSPVSQVSTLQGQTIRWRQHYPHGIPCHHQRIDLDGNFHSASFDDVSLRTPDLRNANWRVGHIHPRNILLFTTKPAGFFQPNRVKVRWRQEWMDTDTLPEKRFLDHVEIFSDLDGTTIFRPRQQSRSTEIDASWTVVEIVGVFKLGQVEDGVGDTDVGTWHFEDLILTNQIEADSGRLSFLRCAVANVRAHAIDKQTPIINAKDTLFKSLRTARSLTRLEYCTVTERLIAEALQASDSIFTCMLEKDDSYTLPPEPLCVRYSAVLPEQLPEYLDSHTRNTRAPVVMFSEGFGEPGYGALHPATDIAVRYAAEDGTEPGAFHFLQLSLRYEAVKEKLSDYLPVGYEAVVIPDDELLAKNF